MTGCRNADGTTWDPAEYALAAGLDFGRAAAEIARSIPEDVKDHCMEIAKMREAEKRAGATPGL